MSEETDKMFETIENFAKQKPEELEEPKEAEEPEEEKITIPNLNDAPRRKRGRPKKTITKDQLDAEKVLVGKIIRLMCVGFTRAEIAKALNIDEQTIKTLKKHYKINEFVKLNNLDVSHRINSTIENFLFGTISKKQILEIQHSKDMSLEEVIEGLCEVAENLQNDPTQRIQAYKAIAEIKGLKIKSLPEGELINLKFEEIYEPIEEELEKPETMNMKSNNASKELMTEFIVADNPEQDLFGE